MGWAVLENEGMMVGYKVQKHRSGHGRRSPRLEVRQEIEPTDILQEQKAGEQSPIQGRPGSPSASGRSDVDPLHGPQRLPLSPAGGFGRPVLRQRRDAKPPQTPSTGDLPAEPGSDSAGARLCPDDCGPTGAKTEGPEEQPTGVGGVDVPAASTVFPDPGRSRSDARRRR